MCRYGERHPVVESALAVKAGVFPDRLIEDTEKMTKTKNKKILVQMKPAKNKSKQRAQPQVSAVGKALRMLGGVGGSSLGALIGVPGLGGAAGTSLGGALSKWLGAGDYTVSENSVVQKSLKASSSIPMMHNDDQSIVVRHREYLGEVRSKGAFTVRQSYELNPGNQQTFPWLSGIAIRFQEYRIRGLVFHYIPSSGNAVSSTNAALGTVMLQTSYRATDAAPVSKVEMLNEYCSNEAVPSEPFAHPIECNPKENPFNVMYVRSGTVPTTDSKLMYDLGITHLAVSGQQADDNVMGDLWVSYEIELKKPLVSSNVTGAAKTANIQYVAGTITTTDFFNGSSSSGGNLGITVSGKTVTFPKGAVGTYLIALRLSGAGTFSATTFTNNQTYTDCTQAYYCRSVAYAGTNVTGTGVGAMFILSACTISDPAVSATFTFGTSAWTGTATTSELTVTQMVQT